MSKAIVLLRKRPDMSTDDFRRHLEDTHLPLVAKLPGLQRVVINHVLPSADGSAQPYDAIAEDWFESVEVAQAALASPESQAIMADMPNFLDSAHVTILPVEEAEVALGTKG
jgi:uncharacterized protein (TIGR02118 family)